MAIALIERTFKDARFVLYYSLINQFLRSFFLRFSADATVVGIDGRKLPRPEGSLDPSSTGLPCSRATSPTKVLVIMYLFQTFPFTAVVHLQCGETAWHARHFGPDD